MKPRDLLLRRHKAVESKLDVIRQAVLAAALNTPDRGTELRDAWREWLRPLRWHLVGLGAAWLLVGLFNYSSESLTTTPVANVSASSPHDIALAVRENRQQLLQLLEPADTGSAPVFVPRRRGDLQSTNAAA